MILAVKLASIAVGAALVAALLWGPFNDLQWGAASAIDGHTLEFGEERISLYGIDAPDRGQTCRWVRRSMPCGDQSRRTLGDLIAGATVWCFPMLRDSDGLHSVCYAHGEDLNRKMVRAGWALSEVTTGRYLDEEAEARQQLVGLWLLQFESPRAWRAQQVSARDGSTR